MASGTEPDGRTTKELSGSFVVFGLCVVAFEFGLSTLIREQLFVGDSFVGACLQAMVRGVLATYRQQAGSHKVYGTWLLLLLLVIGCFVGAFLQAMVGGVPVVYRQPSSAAIEFQA